MQTEEQHMQPALLGATRIYTQTPRLMLHMHTLIDTTCRHRRRLTAGAPRV